MSMKHTAYLLIPLPLQLFKAVAKSAFGQDILWVGGVFFNLLPQIGDIEA